MTHERQREGNKNTTTNIIDDPKPEKTPKASKNKKTNLKSFFFGSQVLKF